MKPLQGLLVADFTHVLSGPFCTMLLADLGARVIKLERPLMGDDARQFGPMHDNKSLYFESINRGKESVAVDLKNPADIQFIKTLLKRADIVVENFKPGTMKKLGLDYDTVKSWNERLIYASISGFGQTGSLSQLPAYDELIQAMSGFMSVTGEPDGPPLKAGPSVSDMLAGTYCFSAITTALYQREKTGQGCQIDIAMFDCMLAFLESDVVAARVLHQIPERRGNTHPNISPFSTYRCQDGDIVICAATDRLFQLTCDVLELPSLKNNPQCQNNMGRITQNDLIKNKFETALCQHSVEYWHTRFVKAGIPAGPINNVEQALNLATVTERQMLVTAGPYSLPGCPIKLSSDTPSPTRTPAPHLNQNGDKIRQEFQNE